MTVGDALDRISSREFVRWRAYFRMKDEEEHRRRYSENEPLHHYLAQIAAEIRMIPAMGKRKIISHDKFLIGFKFEDGTKKSEDKTKEEIEEAGRRKMRKSKQAWAMFFGQYKPRE